MTGDELRKMKSDYTAWLGKQNLREQWQREYVLSLIQNSQERKSMIDGNFEPEKPKIIPALQDMLMTTGREEGWL